MTTEPETCELKLGAGCYSRFDLLVDETLMEGLDDPSRVGWCFRIVGVEGEYVDVTPSCDHPHVVVEVPPALSADMHLGLYEWRLIAKQEDMPDIIAGCGLLRVEPVM